MAVDQLLDFAIKLHGPYTINIFENSFKEREKYILEQRLYNLDLLLKKLSGKMMDDIYHLVQQGTEPEDVVLCLKKSNEDFLIKIFQIIEDTQQKSKLLAKVQLIQRKLVIIDVTEPIAGQLEQVLKMLEELRNPPMSTQTKACIGTIGTATAIAAVVVLCLLK